MWPTFSRRATDERRQYGYDIPIFLSRNLFLNYFTCRNTNECYIFAIARRRLLELTSDSFQSREKVTGAPHAVRAYWLSGASIDFCLFECVGLQQLLELLLRN